MIAFAILSIAGCGAQGEPPFGGYREPDVAPWLDLGPVAFCDGALRLGRPGTKVAGFCVDDPPVLAACRTDADCRSRERCTCGGCQVAWCEAGDECPDGDVCTFADHRCDRPCSTDADCAPGDVCRPGAGVCRARCAISPDCQSGEVCDGGWCSTAAGASGQACGADLDCLDHPVCSLQRTPGDLSEPMPLLEGGAITLYVERAASGSSAIWRARALDGAPEGRWFRFDPTGPVLGPSASDGGRVGAPSVIAPDGTSADYQMVFADGNGRLRRARSADGKTFTADPGPLAGLPESLDSPSLLAPVGSPTGGYLLWFAELTSGAVGVAASADGATFTADAAPALTPASVTDPTLWRGVDRVGAPFALSFPASSSSGRPALRLFFSARGSESGNADKFGMPVVETPNDSIGVAASADGHTLVPWPSNPVFDRVEQFLDHGAESQPAVVRVGDRQLLFYRAAAADGSRVENLRVATNPAP